MYVYVNKSGIIAVELLQKKLLALSSSFSQTPRSPVFWVVDSWLLLLVVATKSFLV